MTTIRFATADDAETILALIRGLAEYEQEPHAVQTNAALIRQQLSSSPPPFECLIAERGGVTAGFALFFHNYSTWRGRQGIWLEDLFVVPEQRGNGVGKALLQRVAGIAVQRDCARFEWSVLDWNQSAIDFYQALGAVPMDEWTTYRVSDAALLKLGES